MKTRIFASFLALTLLGAGCSSAPSASVDSYATNTSGGSSLSTPSVPAEPTCFSRVTSPSSMSSSTYTFPGILTADQVHNKRVRIQTNQGDIVVQLDHEKGPCAASNFLSLAKAGFYDGTIFHRVIPGFMIQGGDPTGTGMGGPGYEFQNDRVTSLPEKEFNMQGQRFNAPYYADGTLAMANAGPDTNGSQFFVMVADYPLSPDYSIFGKVVEGLDIAKKISNLPRNPSDRPNQEVKMIKVTVE